MAEVKAVDGKTLKVRVGLDDAVAMIGEAERHVGRYAKDIVTIIVHFCFCAYDSAALFENMLGIDPKQYLSFSLDAPDAFFYALYGGMAALYERAKALLPPDGAEAQAQAG